MSKVNVNQKHALRICIHKVFWGDFEGSFIYEVLQVRYIHTCTYAALGVFDTVEYT